MWNLKLLPLLLAIIRICSFSVVVVTRLAYHWDEPFSSTICGDEFMFRFSF